MASLLVLNEVSALTHSVFNIGKRVTNIVVSAHSGGDRFGRMRFVFGLTTSSVGFILYTLSRSDKNLRQSEGNRFEALAVNRKTFLSRRRNVTISLLFMATGWFAALNLFALSRRDAFPGQTTTMDVGLLARHHSTYHSEAEPSILGNKPLDVMALDRRIPRHKCLASIRHRQEALLRKYFDTAESIIYIDPAYHHNVGDTLITQGTLKFMGTDKNITQCSYIQADGHSFPPCNEVIREFSAKPNVLAVWQGGGNWGDLYPFHHRKRIQSIPLLLDAGFNVLAMPSSYFYKDRRAESRDQKRIHNAALTYFRQNNGSLASNSTERLVFAWREQYSYKRATEMFPFATNLLVPDMALQLGPYRPVHPPVVDFLVFLRKDRESIVDAKSVDRLVETHGASHVVVDWKDQETLFGSSNMLDTSQSLRLISYGRVSVCDRLHATILAFLAGQPLVYLDQLSGKINKTLAVALDFDACSTEDLNMAKAVALEEGLAIAAEFLAARD